MHRVVTPGFVDPAGVTELLAREAGWMTTSGKIGLPLLAMVKVVGRQQYLPFVLLKEASHIPPGRRKLHTEPVPAEILNMLKERDDSIKAINGKK